MPLKIALPSRTSSCSCIFNPYELRNSLKLLKPASRTAWLKEMDWGLAVVSVLVLVDLGLEDMISGLGEVGCGFGFEKGWVEVGWMGF